MQYTIENDQLLVTVSDHGAELRSIRDVRDGREYLWQADAAYWGRTSPVLFPLVGCYRDKTSVYEGKAYPMSQHGFARDMDFTLEKQGEKELLFLLTDSEASHGKYPFAFRLWIGYALAGRELKVTWRVENPDSRTMYFSIGGHPAFNCDLPSSSLLFKKASAPAAGPLVCGVIEQDGSGCLSPRTKSLELAEGRLALSDELFMEDALIFEDRQADEVALLDAEQKEVLTVRFDSPLFGVWSPVGKHAPFVCIEPWYGRCDRTDYAGDLTGREYGNVLEAGGVFEASYTMEMAPVTD